MIETFRDAIIRAHDLSGGAYMQTDAEMLKRINTLLTKVIMNDPIMRGFLGYGGSESDRDMIRGSGLLAAREVGGP